MFFWVAASVALISQLAVLWEVVAGRAPAASRRPSARWTEIVWVVIPTVALIGVLLATWQRMEQPVAVSPSAGVPA